MDAKRPSGAAFRRKKRVQQAETVQMQNTFTRWLKIADEKETIDTSTSLNFNTVEIANTASCSTVNEESCQSDCDNNNNYSNAPELKQSEPEDTKCDVESSHLTSAAPSSANFDSSACTGDASPPSPTTAILGNIDINNPESWLPIRDSVRCALVTRGPDQGIEADFNQSASEDGRHFTKDWFYKQMPNGENVRRTWLIYSAAKGACFCFPCILFAKERSTCAGKTSSLINATQGNNDWRHLSDVIPQHERNPAHRKCYVKWKQLEMGIKTGNTIDSELQDAIAAEKDIWRGVLRVIVDVIMFCAKNNLPLRGAADKIGAPDSGIFLSTIDLVSHYNKPIADHIARIQTGVLLNNV